MGCGLWAGGEAWGVGYMDGMHRVRLRSAGTCG